MPCRARYTGSLIRVSYMSGNDLKKDSLSAREKGDIYWRKLKYSLRAARQKDRDVDENRSGSNLCMELLARFENEGKGVVPSERITGHEFRRRPPTATGDRSYKDRIFLVMQTLELFRYMAANDSDGSLSEHLKKTISVVEKTLDTWFLANGVDRSSGQRVSSEEAQEAKDKLDRAINLYEDTVRNARRDIARMEVLKLMEEIPEAEEAQSVGIDEFKELISENKKLYMSDKAVIDRACKELLALRKKMAELTKELPGLVKLIAQKGEYSRANRFLTLKDVYEEYMEYVGEQLAAAVWAEDGCASLIRGLLTDRKADPMVANYIKEHWGVTVPSYDMEERVREIEGYTALEGVESDCALLDIESVEDMLKAAEMITEYRMSHLRQFQFQSISAMLFDNEELPVIGSKARSLRNKIAEALKSGALDELPVEGKRLIKDAFVTVEATARVCYMVIEYNMTAKNRTIAELVESFETDVAEMDYTLQERCCRDFVDAYMAEWE